MRGAQPVLVPYRLNQRIIPAYAGSTRIEHSVPGLNWDHPRVCGEHISPDACICTEWGSSPRMRGALFNGKQED